VKKIANKIMAFLAFLGFITSSVVLVITFNAPKTRAVILMAWGLIIFWCVIFGAVSILFKDRIAKFVRGIKINQFVIFVIFCTLLAMLEEAVTVSMTNCAPLFGVKYGEAYITASGNYLDVICFHSVIVFVPMFIFWSLYLKRYDFSPEEVFILFGITGTIAEMQFAGQWNPLIVGFWSWVYGLMVYLPAYSLEFKKERLKPKFVHYLGAILIPGVFVIPVAVLLHIFAPHPTIHFQ